MSNFLPVTDLLLTPTWWLLNLISAVIYLYEHSIYSTPCLTFQSLLLLYDLSIYRNNFLWSSGRSFWNIRTILQHIEWRILLDDAIFYTWSCASGDGQANVLPGNTALGFLLLLSQLLQLQYAFSLDLKEGFVGRQPHVVHAFGIRDPQSGSLAPRQQQDGHFILSDALQTWKSTEQFKNRKKVVLFCVFFFFSRKQYCFWNYIWGKKYIWEMFPIDLM